MATTSRTHYEYLGVPATASTAEIKAAYRKLARTLHPDMPGGSTALFGLITEAHEVLIDPSRRRAYDRELSGGPREPSPSRTTAAPRPSQSASANTQFSGASASGFRATFSDQFRQEAQQRRSQGPGAAQARQRAKTSRGGAPDGGARRTATWMEPQYVKVPTMAWWTYPLILAVTLVSASVRFTGVTAALFGVKDGQWLALGGQWHGVPQLIEDGAGLSSLVSPLLYIAILCAAVTAAYWARARRAPVPRIEKIALLTIWAVLVGAAEFIMVTPTAWLTLMALTGIYLMWLALLTHAPAPTTVEQWQSFTTWCLSMRRRTAPSAAGQREGRWTTWARRLLG